MTSFTSNQRSCKGHNFKFCNMEQFLHHRYFKVHVKLRQLNVVFGWYKICIKLFKDWLSKCEGNLQTFEVFMKGNCFSSSTMFYIHFISSGERVYDITFWKSELNNEISAMATEIENLKVTTDDKCSQIQRKNPSSLILLYFCHGDKKFTFHQSWLFPTFLV